MVIRNVRSRRKILGSSLVEFMIAALLGIIALTLIGGVYISIQKSASEKSKQILLLQNMTSVLQQLKEDVQRAGFNGDSATSAKFSDATNVVHIDSSASLLGYVYKVIPDTSSEYRHVVYRFDKGSSTLQLCEKNHTETLTTSTASISGYLGNCFSIFDSQQITVSDFAVHLHTLENVTTSAFITIKLVAALTAQPSTTQQIEMQVKQRNWL